jgi:hypothetical protein
MLLWRGPCAERSPGKTHQESIVIAENNASLSLQGSCHCGAVRLTLPSAPEKATRCNVGLTGIETEAIDIPTPFADFDAYWRPFLGGQGPAPGYAMSLDETAQARLRDRIRQRMPIAADGSIALTARAWAVRAHVA